METILVEIMPLSGPMLDKLFDTSANQFAPALEAAALNLYKKREKAFGSEIMRKVERDIYLQILDNLWMQHLENMNHLREGIHWISVGQRDPLVEYRRQSQVLFEELQLTLRHEVIRTLFHAQPVDEAALERAVETELTRAARSSVDNAGQILEAESFEESDFQILPASPTVKTVSKTERKKARKAERHRRKSGKKHRK